MPKRKRPTDPDGACDDRVPDYPDISDVEIIRQLLQMNEQSSLSNKRTLEAHLEEAIANAPIPQVKKGRPNV